VDEFYEALLGEPKTFFSMFIRDALEPSRAANRVLTVPPVNDATEAKALSIFHSHPEAILSFRGPCLQIASPFHAAAASGCLELLKAMSKHILENDTSRSEAERQRRLLKMVNKRALGLEGKTPLMLAGMLGKDSCVKFLVERGADCLAKEALKGLTAIHLTIRHGHPGCIDAMLTEEPQVMGPLMGPFQPRRPPYQMFNALTNSGFAPLHYAVAFFQHECLDTLLKYSPQLNSRGAGIYSRELGMYCAVGTTPLHVAALKNNLRAAYSILRHHMNIATLRDADGSANVDPRFAKDSDGRTAYQIARMHPTTDPGLVELLALDSDLLGHFQNQLPTFGPPKLSAIAAIVLKNKLLTDLQRVSDHNQAYQDTEPSCPNPRASASGIRVLSSASAFISTPPSPSSNNASPGVRNSSPIGRVPSVPRAEGVRPFQVGVSDPSTSIPRIEVAVAATMGSDEILVASEALMAEMEVAEAKARAETPGASTMAVCFICFDAKPDVTISGCHHRLCGTCAKAMVEKAKASKILACPFCRKSVSGFKV
jgi:ankyrin repeat protein